MCYKVACTLCGKQTWAGCGTPHTSSLSLLSREARFTPDTESSPFLGWRSSMTICLGKHIETALSAVPEEERCAGYNGQGVCKGKLDPSTYKEVERE
jgi:hypothetical protein